MKDRDGSGNSSSLGEYSPDFRLMSSSKIVPICAAPFGEVFAGMLMRTTTKPSRSFPCPHSIPAFRGKNKPLSSRRCYAFPSRRETPLLAHCQALPYPSSVYLGANSTTSHQNQFHHYPPTTNPPPLHFRRKNGQKQVILACMCLHSAPCIQFQTG